MDLADLKYDINNSYFYANGDKIKILAHDNELLNEHIIKTKIIFDRLLDKPLLKNFHDYFYQKNYIDVNYDNFRRYLYKMVDFHDIAKISFNFQVDRLKNDDVVKILKKYDLDKFIGLIEPKHSFISSLLYTSYLLNREIDFEKNKLLILLSYVIYGHHTSLKDILFESKFTYSIDEYSDTFGLFSGYINEKAANSRDYQHLQDSFYSFLDKIDGDSSIAFFYSYIYSLLVSSDVIASSYSDKSIESVKKYSKKWNNRINGEIVNTMEQKFYELNYNKKCKEISNEDLLSEDEINSLSDINDLRTEMLKEASFNLTKSLKTDQDKKIFYLNLPTGGGKTNTSMKLALDILENTDADRVIYAMPFINIIEQNYDVIKDNFGLSEDNGKIRAIYSASESFFSDNSDDDKSEMILKDSFFDYPVICTTFVSLFNALIKNKKRYKYSLSALTNSVIILDEIQSLPLKNWTSLYYLINEISKNFNVYFIIMSATLPEFDELKINKDVKFDYSSIHLINESKKYFLHSLFNRTEIKGNITELDAEEFYKLRQYFEGILKENFQKGCTKGLVVLNTIKMSKLAYKCLNRLKNELSFDIDLLNSTIIPSEKRKIICKINKVNKVANEDKYILVSTQSIEAGVDVSFDFVVRDFATLDSIEQVQGRCNRSRELNKRFNDVNAKGNVYIMNIKRKNRYDHNFIYDSEEIETKIKETGNTLKNFLNYSYENVLDYYKAVSDNLNLIQDDKEENFVFMDRNNLESWKRLKYSELMDKHYGIHIIQNKNLNCSFFVQSTIDILINNKWLEGKLIESMNLDELDEFYKDHKNEFIFTFNEIKYLKGYESKYEVRIIKNNHVDGKQLIECYKKCTNKLKKDFGAKKIIQKEFSSILYKFIFQVTGNDFDDLIETQELKKIGYFYVIPEEKIGEGERYIYSMQNGFNFDFMKKENDSAGIL